MQTFNIHPAYTVPSEWTFVASPTPEDSGAGFLNWECVIAQGSQIAATVVARRAVGACKIGFPHTSTFEEARAIATLFMAAPELQSAVNALLGLITLVAQRDDIPADIKSALLTSHRIEEAHAALAKATYTAL